MLSCFTLKLKFPKLNKIDGIYIKNTNNMNDVNCFLIDDDVCKHENSSISNRLLYYTFTQLRPGENFLIETRAFTQFKDDRYYSAPIEATFTTSMFKKSELKLRLRIYLKKYFNLVQDFLILTSSF